ncbi:MAG: sodium-dependent transporter [Candidatus Calescibacterium sp.]|nr:sodium-dependent transporter [Candidatus Calescibacterium sp.]MCX7734685.1 sodium-dependent transporter [bacterium]MDW8087579.1 sodium-dependent transporter [Candidatus Calescibacterium sp.]
MEREHWKTRFGLILAMAGNAIGLGNFLRFPTQAAQNGGGAYIIPYFISLLLLGIPLMWLEWSMGRYGGKQGFGSPSGIFYSIKPKMISLYLGILGIFVSFIITVYYSYIESWTLSYAILSFLNKLPDHPETFTNAEEFTKPFAELLLQNIGETRIKEFCIGAFCLKLYTPSLFFYLIFILVFVINISILIRGITEGIEKFSLFAMPLLFLMGVTLMIRVFFVESPHNISVEQALGFLWEPKFEGLKSADVWLKAAGQVFFTLSIGISIIMTYASYVDRGKDIALSGLTTTMLNEFAEIVLGGSISLVAAVLFFGAAGAQEIAEGGAFRLGFASMPAIFSEIEGGRFFGTIWFLLLFFAGVTSSIALASPFISFLEDEIGLERKRAVLITAVIWFAMSHVVIFLKGSIDEMDFWAGTFGLITFAFIEIVYGCWVLGEKKIYEELSEGALIKVPKIFIFIMKYISPVYIFGIFIFWVYENYIVGERPPVDENTVITRIVMLSFLILLVILVRKYWHKRMEQKSKTRA